MHRQRSDLSENLKISSTPEAESYFERKNKTMSERYEKGELDIEVVSMDNNDDVNDDNIDVLEVLDKEKDDVPNLENIPTEEVFDENNFVEVVELGNGAPLDVLPVHVDVVKEDSEKDLVEQKKEQDSLESNNVLKLTSSGDMQDQNELFVEPPPSASNTLSTCERLDDKNDGKIEKNDSLLTEGQQQLEVFSAQNVSTKEEEDVIPAELKSENGLRGEQHHPMTSISLDKSTEIESSGESIKETIAISDDTIVESIDKDGLETLSVSCYIPQNSDEMLILAPELENSLPKKEDEPASKELPSNSETKTTVETIESLPDLLELNNKNEMDDSKIADVLEEHSHESLDTSVEETKLIQQSAEDNTSQQVDNQENQVQKIDDVQREASYDGSLPDLIDEDDKKNYPTDEVRDETSIQKQNELVVLENIEAFNDPPTDGERSIWSEVSYIDRFPLDQIVASSPSDVHSDSVASSDFDVNRYKISHDNADVETIQNTSLNLQSDREDEETLSPSKSDPCEPLKPSEPFIDPCGEVKVLDSNIEISPLTDDSKEKSSSFETLYDTTQVEAISSTLPLPSSDYDNTPLVGDPFVGTFEQSNLSSSFEDLYRRTACVGEEEQASTPSIRESEMMQFQDIGEANDERQDEAQSNIGVVEKKESTPVFHEWNENRWSESDPSNLVDPPVEVHVDVLKFEDKSEDPESDSIHSDTLKESLREDHSVLTETGEETTLKESLKEDHSILTDTGDDIITSTDLEKQLMDDLVFVGDKSAADFFIPSEPQEIPILPSQESTRTSSGAHEKGSESLASSAPSDQSFHIGLDRKRFFPSSSPDTPGTVNSSSVGSTRGSSRSKSSSDRRSESQDTSTIDSENRPDPLSLLNMAELEIEEDSLNQPFEIPFKGQTFFPSASSQDTTPRTESVCSPCTVDAVETKSEGDERMGLIILRMSLLLPDLKLKMCLCLA